MNGELSLIKSYFNLFLITMNHKHCKRFSYSNCYHWCKGMLLADNPEDDEFKKENEELLKELEDIYLRTHKEVNASIPAVEFILSKNLEERGLTRKVTLNGKNYYVFKLHFYLEQALSRIMIIVTKLAKRYSLDMPFNALNMMQKDGNEMQF